jgi:hypothetical protein
MAVPKPLPIAAAIAGLLAAIGISVKLATSTDPLGARVDKLLAREAEFGDNFENLSSRVDDLSGIEADPGFTKLPAAKQNSVREHLTELRAVQDYRSFETKLNEIPDPKTVRSLKQLNEISLRLSQLPEPPTAPQSLKNPEAVRRRQEWLEEARALSSAADQLSKEYQRVLESGNRVLDKKNEPNLPARIREVLAAAKSLKTPESDKDKPLPGSEQLAYALVFRMVEIQELLEEWKKLKEKLEPAAKSEKR